MKKYSFVFIAFLLLISVGCEKEVANTSSFETTTEDEINHFIWKGLNLYYLWQDEVPNLADTKFNNLDDLYTYFRNSSSPQNTFQNLLYQPDVVDRFSWMVDDYIALENSFQGINLTTGIEFGLRRYANSNTNVYGYVRYVIPNSSAATEGIKRGMIFNTINSTQLTVTNYNNLLFGEAVSFTIGLADYNNGNPESNGSTHILTKTELQENPIAISKVITEDTKKIGYFMYNQFASSYDQNLNAVFSNFKSENIDYLIIDLRYNPGGSTATAGYLGAMVTGQFPNEIYSIEAWNRKVTDAFSATDFINNFPTRIVKRDSNNNIVVDEAINSLKLDRVYFIVSGSSASASELIINALDAYIDVKVVGVATVGKQVGSITLYDSDNLQRSGNNLSTKHTYAMQPLVFEIQNKNGKNYPNGIVPGNIVGSNFQGINLAENPGNLGALGERSDPLLDRTLTYITTGSKSSIKNLEFTETKEIFDSKLATPASNRMYTSFQNKLK